jgi:hypothetical protein
VLTTDQKGAIAESATVATAIKLGIGVYRSMFEGGRYDLIFDLGRLVRVQCKYVPRQGDVIGVRCYSFRRSRDGFAALVDGRSHFQLRLGPTRNAQAVGVHWGPTITSSSG